MRKYKIPLHDTRSLEHLISLQVYWIIKERGREGKREGGKVSIRQGMLHGIG